jgi:uncharacterized repeat protein (TIGR03803 family)
MHQSNTKLEPQISVNISRRGLRFGSTNHVTMMLAVLSGMLLAATPSALAQSETVLYSFGSEAGDGTNPGCCLILDKQSTLYGTTNYGGAYGFGTVYKLTPTGAETVLYSFGVADIVPSPAGLISDQRGNFYGTTVGGGANDEGTVFKMTSNGTVTVLHNFGSQPGDGTLPGWGLVLDKQNNLYGTTNYGGAYGSGTVYRLTPTGDETVLYSFGVQAGDATVPSGRLTFDKRGNLYGATATGGAYGYGTVFRLTRSGDETVLYSFGGQAGDFNPGLDLVLDKQGNLYGTTGNGGAYNSGAVYRLTPTGIQTVLHSFGQSGDGIFPICCLILDKQGNLFGTTYDSRSAQGHGTVFKLTPAGDETVLHIFGIQPGDGIYPIWSLVLDKQGNIYGTTSQGGANGYGTLFRVTP